MSEMLDYAPSLKRSITQRPRRASTMEFSHYDEVPGAIASKVLEKLKKKEEAEEK